MIKIATLDSSHFCFSKFCFRFSAVQSSTSCQNISREYQSWKVFPLQQRAESQHLPGLLILTYSPNHKGATQDTGTWEVRKSLLNQCKVTLYLLSSYQYIPPDNQPGFINVYSPLPRQVCCPTIWEAPSCSLQCTISLFSWELWHTAFSHKVVLLRAARRSFLAIRSFNRCLQRWVSDSVSKFYRNSITNVERGPIAAAGGSVPLSSWRMYLQSIVHVTPIFSPGPPDVESRKHWKIREEQILKFCRYLHRTLHSDIASLRLPFSSGGAKLVGIHSKITPPRRETAAW